jgi:hypothetical protein
VRAAIGAQNLILEYDQYALELEGYTERMRLFFES